MTEIKNNSETLFPRRVFAISDFEFSNGTLKFFKTRGLFRKKNVLVRAIPVIEINAVESYWNELSITWNNVTNIFFKKNSYESFSDLRDKLQVTLEEHRILLQQNEESSFRRMEGITVIKAIIPIIDFCFDMLIASNDEKIDWKRVNESCINLGQNLQMTNRMLPTLTLNFTKIGSAVTIQSSQEAVKESLNLLTSIHQYFSDLAQEDDMLERSPNRLNAIIDLYYTLNDIFLGKVVGEKDSIEENDFLKDTLAVIDAKNFKLNIQELKVSIERYDIDFDKQGVIKVTRDLFKSHLSRI